MKTYIAGQITGTPKEECFNKFLECENILKGLGHEVVNPLRLHGINSIEDYEKHEPKPWKEYLRIDVAALMDCDAAYFMPCWTESKGARLEHSIAEALNLERYYQLC